MTDPIRIGVAGGGGQMGRALLALIDADPALAIAGASEAPGSPLLGTPVAAILGAGATTAAAFTDAATVMASADVWIDFTTPGATISALAALEITLVRAVIIGTTGFDQAGEAAVAAAARRTTVVQSGNFSLGVNLLAGLVRQAAARLGPDWDIEIIEAHHRRKVDAPSGTARMLGAAAALGRGGEIDRMTIPARDGITGARPEGGIGFAVVRGGGIIGDHDVLFAAEDEQITLSHRAGSRTLFARGALHAARWALDQPAGLYGMADVLGLD